MRNQCLEEFSDYFTQYRETGDTKEKKTERWRKWPNDDCYYTCNYLFILMLEVWRSCQSLASFLSCFSLLRTVPDIRDADWKSQEML